jgi:cytochrome c biogenesis protein
MSVAEKTIEKSVIQTEQASPSVSSKSKPFLNKVLDLLSSVRLGVMLLVIMVVLAMIGMLIVQQNVDGFDRFYGALTPAEKLVYAALGFFDIYHTWYFNFLLLILSLNIVLASIDRFPTAWSYLAQPKIEATKAYLLKQKNHQQLKLMGDQLTIVPAIAKTFEKFGFKLHSTAQKDGRVIIFGQKNVWNRLGAYVVHVALLLLFLGHFVALQTGYDADVRLMPGTTTNQIQLIRYNLDQQGRAPVNLPFSLYCTDIEQKLVDKNGSIEVSNTLDWFTRMQIDDPAYGKRDVSISLNQPYTYRGFRFFQASAITVGSARKMTLRLSPENGGEPITAVLPRNGSVVLPDNTKIEYQNFFADFAIVGGKPDTRSADYNNPAVQLKITSPAGDVKNAYAFAADLPASAPVGAPIFGFKYKLADFEKSPMAHVLSIKYDPFYGSTIAWYWGGGLLMLALCGVFFFAHQRIWAIVEQDGKVTIGGHTNRNEFGFEDKFKKIVSSIH